MKPLVKIFLIIILVFLSFIGYNYYISRQHQENIIKAYRTRVFQNNFYEDVNGDGILEKLSYEYQYCEHIDSEGNFRTISKEEDLPDDIYIKVYKDTRRICETPKTIVNIYDSDYNKIATTDYIDVEGSTVSELYVVDFKEEKLITLDTLDIGAHSSSMVVMRIEGDVLTPVCPSDKKGSNFSSCVFWSDAGGPYPSDLDNDGIPEIIEEKHTYGLNNFEEIILRAVYKYENGELINTENEEYDRFLDLYKKISHYPTVISKYE